MKDLHIHTKYSDGELDEFEIIQEVQNSKIKEFAIADHDTIDGSKKVFDILNEKNYDLIFHPAVELTCRVNEYLNGINVHLLIQDFDYNNEKLLSLINEVSELRFKKIQKMVDYIEKIYKIDIPKHELQKTIKKTKSFGKPHLYSILCKIGKYNREEYYDTMDKLSTAEFKLDAKKVITDLKDNCKIILAHPIEIMEEYNFSVDDIEKLIVYLKNLGLTGIETHHSSQTKALQNKLSIIAQKHNLIESFGSDFHGENVKPGLKIGQIFREEKGNK